MVLRNRIVNPIVRTILRSPAHRLLSGSLALVTVTGRRTGRAYTTPVMYAQDGADIYVLVGDPERKTWWRNLRSPARARVRIAGREFPAEGLVLDTVSHPGDVITALRAYGRRFPRAVPGEQPGTPVVFVRLRPYDVAEETGEETGEETAGKTVAEGTGQRARPDARSGPEPAT